MRLTYDPRYNIAYIRFQEKRTDVETVRISDELVVDMAPDGTIYGIETPDSIGFRGWWKTCVSNRMIPPLALYCVWSKQRRIGSQRHGTIPRKEYLCAVGEGRALRSVRDGSGELPPPSHRGLCQASGAVSRRNQQGLCTA